MFNKNAPGVYIEEIQSSGPINGAGTSTAAFVGPTLKGPVSDPTRVNNITEFKDLFGEYFTDRKRLTTYTELAVRGFFENGGTSAYVVRVSAARRAAEKIDARSGTDRALFIEAQLEGRSSNAIQVTISDASLIDSTKGIKIYRTTAELDIQSITGSTIVLKTPNDAKQLIIGDMITFDDTGERAEIFKITDKNELVVTNSITATTAKQLRIADLVSNQKVFRLSKRPTELGPGSVIHLKQVVGMTAVEENCLVRKIEESGFVTIEGMGLANPYSMKVKDGDVGVTSLEFDLKITGVRTETFQGLSMDPRHTRYFLPLVKSMQVKFSLPTQPTAQLAPGNFPKNGIYNLKGGDDDEPSLLTATQYGEALNALRRVRDVSLVCAPDLPMAWQADLVTHCELMGDRFALLDPVAGAGPTEIQGQRAKVESQRGYAALYYPRILITDPSDSSVTVALPPSGHIAGIFARSDAERGVHKAPANELVRGALGLESLLDDNGQDSLNAAGINVLRIFPGKARPTVWGARTTVPRENTTWRYVNVRRLFLFVEQSILEGIRWAVFEPNNLNLWKKLHRNLTEFLTRVWRSGALFGATADQAFYVKIDEELNPPAARALGQVNIEIGMAPVRPAEFVIVRIGMWEGGSNLGEG